MANAELCNSSSTYNQDLLRIKAMAYWDKAGQS